MKINVLFVDDNVGMTGYLTRLFRQSDYSFFVANSADEALSLMEAYTFGVIVSDQCMPEMNGTKFLNKAHQKQPDAIKIIFSGYHELMLNDHWMATGAINRIIPKPCFDDELVNFVDRAVIQHIEATLILN